MDVNQSIMQLGARLDAWWDRFCPLIDSDDRVAQAKALLSGFEIAKEFDRLKTDGLAAIQTLLDDCNAPSGDKGGKSLIGGFEFGARLANILHDEFLDTDAETKVMRLLDAIVIALNGMASVGPLSACCSIIPTPVCAFWPALTLSI